MFTMVTLKVSQLHEALEVLGTEINARIEHGNNDVDDLLAVFDALNDANKIIIEQE